MTEAEISIYSTIKSALKPTGNVDLIEWAKRNCYVCNSPKGNTVDFNLTPYFKEIYTEVITNPNLKEINICAPTGAGKSALLLALAQTTVALYHKELMIVAQSEKMTLDFLNIHLKPALRKNKNILRMWPKRDKDTKESLHFPHMNIFTGYATAPNTLQSRSVDLLVMDEVWMFTVEGVIEEARRRLQNRPASKMVNVSQGGTLGDQFHKTYSLGLLKEYAWKCEGCDSRNIYKFADLKFECIKDSDGIPIWNTVYAELECPCCNKRYPDIIENRRKLSEGGIYVVEDPEQNYLPQHVSYNFNALALYDVSWTQTALDFLTANHSNMRRTALKQFEQKRLGLFYDESKNVETFNLEAISDGYLMDQYKDDPWEVRLMTVDVQGSQMWIVIRDWTKQGASRLVSFKYCSHFHDIERIRVEYNIKPKAVFIDAAHRSPEVKQACAQYGWMGLNGLKDTLYKWKERSGRTVEKMYSSPDATRRVPIKLPSGNKIVHIINYAGTTTKDTLATIQNNPNTRWLIPNGGENYAQYLHQIQGSERREISKISGKPFYTKVKDANHGYDCEVMQIIASQVWQCLVFGGEEVKEDS
jgi:hypothetical protein